MTRPSPIDAGFVLLDALMAVALAAFAGGTIISIANSMLEQQARELDRSVALVASQSLMRQYLLLGEVGPLQDELYRYDLVSEGPANTSTLRSVAIVAVPLNGIGGRDVRLDFLAPTASK